MPEAARPDKGVRDVARQAEDAAVHRREGALACRKWRRLLVDDVRGTRLGSSCRTAGATGSAPRRPHRYGQNERGLALGRKNSLFVGTNEAGENLAGLYSLIATCEANGVNPVDYLADVLIRVQTHPASRIDELLPHNWSPLRPKPSA